MLKKTVILLLLAGVIMLVLGGSSLLSPTGEALGITFPLSVVLILGFIICMVLALIFLCFGLLAKLCEADKDA